MLRAVAEIIEAFDAAGVRYALWKSNARLVPALEGDDDLDLLVDAADATRVAVIARAAGFVPAQGDAGGLARHWFRLDEASGCVVHLDVLARIDTGGSLQKPYHLPVEARLLDDTRRVEGVPIPSRGAEHVLFVVRKAVEAASPLEHFMLMREWDDVQEELDWLDGGETVADWDALSATWTPGVPGTLIADFRVALRRRGALLARWRAGRRIARCLSARRAAHPLLTAVRRAWRFGVLVSVRLRGRHYRLTPAGGGCTIAFIGGDASGKTTLLASLSASMDSAFDVRHLHLGKPAPGLLTFLPSLALPLMRRLLPGQRSTAMLGLDPAMRTATPERAGIAFVARSVMLALDRRRAALRAAAAARGGAVVFCDRYPAPRPGDPDGPQIAATPGERGAIARLGDRIEERLYRAVPPPDIVVVLSVDVETALRRDAARTPDGRGEGEGWVRERHARSARFAIEQAFPGAQVVRVDTSGALQPTLESLRAGVWRAMIRRAASVLSPGAVQREQ